METSLLEDVDKDNEDDSLSTIDDRRSSSSKHREQVSNAEEKRQGICSPAILICVSHALSAWGDRMWAFAISIFLISLTPNTLRLVAIYGMVVSLSVVAFGTLVGDWIDATPRLKAARLTLIIQNVAVLACAGVLLLMLITNISTFLFYLLDFVLILLAIVARLSSLGTTIAIERDWVVVIAKEDEAVLAGTNAKLRRIDLTCNILAPIITGVVLSVGSRVGGICFIAGWNILSLFVEYYILTSVYRSCPALADKTVDVSRHGRVEAGDTNGSCENFRSLDLDDEPVDGTVLVPRVKTVRSLKNTFVLLLKKIKSRARTIRLGVKLYFQQKVAFAGLGLACLYLTVLGFNSITTGYAYSQHLSAAVLGILTAAGALTGIIGTFIFPKFRRIFGLARTGVISMSIQLFFLMFCVASVWAPGHPGHLLDPFRDHSDTSRAEITVSPCQFSTTLLKTSHSTYSVSVANLNIRSSNGNSTERPMASAVPSFPVSGYVIGVITSTTLRNTTALAVKIPSTAGNGNIFPVDTHTSHIAPSPTVLMLSASASLTECDSERNASKKKDSSDTPSSYIHLGLLMGGLVMSRTGLWMTDLVITQLFQENVAEKERGIVGGVQNSFNNIMDVAHFVLVIVASKPEHFGALILVSVSMVSLGFAFYAKFAWTFRRRLLQLEKLSHWSASNESFEGTSRRLRPDSKSNSEEDMMKGVLTVENENYFA